MKRIGRNRTPKAMHEMVIEKRIARGRPTDRRLKDVEESVKRREKTGIEISGEIVGKRTKCRDL